VCLWGGGGIRINGVLLSGKRVFKVQGSPGSEKMERDWGEEEEEER